MAQVMEMGDPDVAIKEREDDAIAQAEAEEAGDTDDTDDTDDTNADKEKEDKEAASKVTDKYGNGPKEDSDDSDDEKAVGEEQADAVKGAADSYGVEADS